MNNKTSEHLAGFLKPNTQKAFAANQAGAADDEKALHHSQLEKVRKHVFENSSTYDGAHHMMKNLIDMHKNLYDKDEKKS